MLIPKTRFVPDSEGMKFTQLIKTITLTSAITFGGLAITASAAQAAPVPTGCSYFDTGRVTCRTHTGGGSYTYNSYNPYTGYSSYGRRTVSGTSSWGSLTYSSPASYGNRSYTSSGLGSRSYTRFTTGWNSNRGSWSSITSRSNIYSDLFSSTLSSTWTRGW